MPTQLESIVQRMIDANESEENIAAVIQGYPSESDVTPVAADEPDTYWGGARKGAVEGVVGGVKGYAQGWRDVALHPVDTAVGIARDAAGLISDTAEGVGKLYYQPRQAIEDIKGVPGKIAGAVKSGLSQAATDPEGFGRSVGRTAAITGLTGGISGGLRILPKPLARGVGAFAKETGIESRFPARLIGFHQVASGNPLGLATVMAPRALEKVGGKLERWGTAAGASAGTVPARVAAIRNSLATGALTPEKAMLEVQALQRELAPRIAGSQLTTDAVAALREQKMLDALQSHVGKAVKAPAGGLSAADQALLDKILARNASPTAGKAATVPSVAKTTPPAATRVGVSPPAAVTDPGMAKWISSGGAAEEYTAYLAKREALAQAKGRQGGLTPQQQTAQLQMEQRMEKGALKFAGKWEPGQSPARQAELKEKFGGTQEVTPATAQTRPPVQKKVNPEPEPVRSPEFVSPQEWADLGGTASGYPQALEKMRGLGEKVPRMGGRLVLSPAEAQYAAQGKAANRVGASEKGMASANRMKLTDAEKITVAALRKRGMSDATIEDTLIQLRQSTAR